MELSADSNPNNSAADCNPQWNMGSYPSWPFRQEPTALALHVNAQSGWVEWDVTADVAAFLAGTPNHGWLVRKADESQSGRADYSSREGSQPPQLVLTLGTPPPPTPTLTATADTYVRSGSPNQSQGYDTILRVQDSGNNRALVQFSQAVIASVVGGGTLQSARIRLYIIDNGNNWGSAGRPVSAHRITRAWTEAGATWNCPDDTNPVNSAKDCNPDWQMGQTANWPFVATPTASVTHQNNQTGWVEWNVTADVAAFLAGTATNYGWLIKKDDEGASGRADYGSREGNFKPELVLTVTQPPTQPLITSISPSSAQPGQTLTVRILGMKTSFGAGTQVSFGAGIRVGNGPEGGFGPVTVVNATTLDASITVTGSALEGLRTISVQSGATTLTFPDGFFVEIPQPFCFPLLPGPHLPAIPSPCRLAASRQARRGWSL
ncbi:MAG: DNRLRE domain-containing protein [Bryobacterales bacterium]|nr:DNRLRE domain-containing protein [Bryobacterales bacterium]